MTDLTFPITRSAAADALGISNSLVGRRVRDLQEFHSPDAVLSNDKLTRYGFERLKELSEIGKRAYEEKYPHRAANGSTGAALATTNNDAPTKPEKLGLMPDTSDIAPTEVVPEDAFHQRHARYGDIAQANQSATSQRFAQLAQANRKLIEGAMAEGKQLGQMLAAAQQQAMLAEYQRQNAQFQSQFSQLGDDISEGE